MGLGIIKRPAVLKRPMARSILRRPSGIGLAAIAPKRGKRLMYRRPCGKTAKVYNYTRLPNMQRTPSTLCLNLQDVYTLSKRELLRRLLRIGLLVRMKRCPSCGGSVTSVYDDMNYQGRCRHKHCHIRIGWMRDNPLFFSGHGARSIRDQLAPLLSAVLGMSTVKTCPI